MEKNTNDLDILNNLPDVYIWGDDLDKFGKIPLFKGKFRI